jgi:uncharacterized protein
MKVVRRCFKIVKRLTPCHKLAECSMTMDLGAAGAKGFTTVKDGDAILDYRDVKITGYLSTWDDLDRDGEKVRRGAFQQTIGAFLGKNPVLLVNHERTAQSTVGRFTKLVEDDKGLYVEAMISNSPDPFTTGVRWKVAEGVLRTLSMGGMFHYDTDRKTIRRVDLHEGSLVPVPSNPGCTVSVREVTPGSAKANPHSATLDP